MASTPLPSEGAAGGQDSKTATATCFCGAVQLLFPTEGDGLIDSFVCNCADCKKARATMPSIGGRSVLTRRQITASMFASNFVVKTSETTHVRGKDVLTKYAQSQTVASGNVMENHFCSICGTLMYRISSGYPDFLITRIGTVDDFELQETKLKPRIEIFVKGRVGWLKGVEGCKQYAAQGPLGTKS